MDCIAYDYDNNIQIGVEIESPSHVKTHSEDLKAHMLEIEPFKNCMFELRVKLRKG